jgi:predicted lipid-binding transport protein (Tim44 family)
LMVGKVVGRVLAGLVTGLLSFVAGLVGGLLKGLLMPFALLAANARRKWRRKRDVRAMKKDWRALKKGRVESVSDLGRKTRKRIEKRGASVKRRLAS